MARYWEDYNVGDKFYTRGRTVTDSLVSVCSGLLGITERFVWDEEQAKKSVFGARTAPGTLMLVLVDALQLLSHDGARPFLDPETSIALVGIEGRFKSPTHLGATVSAESEIMEKKETRNPERGIIIFKSILRNQLDVELIEAKLTHLVMRRPGGAPA